MQIQDFNRPAAVAAEMAAGTEATVIDGAAATLNCGEDMTRARTEISLLQKRVEHLELVVETARSLMTSNQERLLRRLHDLPQEMMVLTAALSRLDQGVARRMA